MMVTLAARRERQDEENVEPTTEQDLKDMYGDEVPEEGEEQRKKDETAQPSARRVKEDEVSISFSTTLFASTAS